MDRLDSRLHPDAQAARHAFEPSTALMAMRDELARCASGQGYLESAAWRAAQARLVAHSGSPDDLSWLSRELARVAVAGNWIFPDQPPPLTTAGRLRALVELARGQATRCPLVRVGFLSALLALGRAWGIDHTVLADAVATRSVVERWAAAWDPACEMEGLLGAAQVCQRLAEARAHLDQAIERRGQKGWLSRRDLQDLYVGLLEQGVPKSAAREWLGQLKRVADKRGWAYWGPWPSAASAAERLERLVTKVAQQAARTPRVSDGFRQALLSEAVAAGLDPATLTTAIVERREREQWTAAFDRSWGLPRLGPAPWWPRLIGAWPGRRLAATALRTVPALMVVVGAGLAPGRPVVGGTRAAMMAGPAAAVTEASVLPTAMPPPAPAPIELVVAHTDGLGARLRAEPKTGPVEVVLSEGATVVVIGPDVEVDGTRWKQVRTLAGTRGWMAADLLGVVSPAEGAHPDALYLPSDGKPGCCANAFSGTGWRAVPTGL